MRPPASGLGLRVEGSRLGGLGFRVYPHGQAYRGRSLQYGGARVGALRGYRLGFGVWDVLTWKVWTWNLKERPHGLGAWLRRGAVQAGAGHKACSLSKSSDRHHRSSSGVRQCTGLPRVWLKSSRGGMAAAWHAWHVLLGTYCSARVCGEPSLQPPEASRQSSGLLQAVQ